jgi:hypothetical protein
MMPRGFTARVDAAVPEFAASAARLDRSPSSAGGRCGAL